jgi:hypothetical protein
VILSLGDEPKKQQIRLHRSAFAGEIGCDGPCPCGGALLITTAFCIFNRYVDGLAAWTPDEPGAYEAIGKRIVERGYLVRV